MPRTGRSASEDAELLGAVADQTAVGMKKAELIERLTAENTVKDMFDALAAGSVEAAKAKAMEAGLDLDQPHLFLHLERAPGGSNGGPVCPTWRRAGDALRRLGHGRCWRRSPTTFEPGAAPRRQDGASRSSARRANPRR